MRGFTRLGRLGEVLEYCTGLCIHGTGLLGGLFSFCVFYCILLYRMETVRDYGQYRSTLTVTNRFHAAALQVLSDLSTRPTKQNQVT